MAVILQLFAQSGGEAHIPRDEDWWINVKLWSDRPHVEVVSRPTEAKALLHLWLESRALRHYDRYRTILTSVERKAKDLELQALRTPHIRGEALYTFIATRMTTHDDHWTWRRAQGILEDVTAILRQAEMETLLELQDKAKKRRSAVFKEIVQEAMREGIGRAA